MAKSKSLRNRIVSAVMALVMVLAYVPVPAPILVDAAENTNEASVTTAGTQGQSGVTTEYATLSEAVTAANASEGSTITLLKDVSTTERVDIIGKDITLELNGKTITLSNGANLIVHTEASLTVKSSVDGGKITTSDASSTISNRSTLVVESGTIENTAPVNGITKVGIDNTGTLTINNGNISGTSYGVYVSIGKATINNGEISGENAVAVSPMAPECSVELVVKGGKLIGTRSGIRTACVVGDVTVTISNGYISGGDYALYNNDDANITINGGTLSGDTVVYDEEGDIGAVTLGTGVTLYDENYDVVELSSATGTVYALTALPEEAKKISVTVGGNVTTYFTLAEAVTVANANEGSTITLLKDVIVAEETFIEGKDITLELNGKVLSGGNGNGVLRVTSKGSLTVKSSVDGGKITTDNGDRVINNHGTLVIDSGAFINTYLESGTVTTAIISRGTLTVNGGTINGCTYGVDVRAGKTTINGGEISGNDGICIGVASSSDATAELEINGGRITATARGIFAGSVNGEQTVTINGGEIVGSSRAVSNGTNCETTINGGVLSGNTVVYESSGSLGVFLGEGVALYNADGAVVGISNAVGKVHAIKGDVVATVVKDGNVTGYGTLDAAITAAGQDWSVINIVKNIKIDRDMTVETSHNWIVSDEVTVTLSDSVTLTFEGVLTNSGTISGGVVANTGIIYNNGTIGKIVNSGSLYSREADSVITGELVINWENAEDRIIDLSGCYFPNGLKVSGTIGEKAVTIQDILLDGYTLVDKDGKEIAFTEGQTSVTGEVYIGLKKVIKVTSGSNEKLFATFEDAFAYAEEYSKVTITLLEDITIDDCIDASSSDDMVFDLNGKKITFVPGENGSAYSVLNINTYNDEKFTLKSSVPGGCIDASQADYAISTGGVLVIESGTFIGGSCAIENGGQLVINGGVFKGTYSAIENYMMLTTNGGTFEATGVSTEDDVCVTLYNGGSITINGGTFNNVSTIWNDTGYRQSASVAVLGGTYPNGFGVVKSQTIADVLPSNSALYKSVDDTKVSLTEGQTSIAEAVCVKATEVVSVTTKDGGVKKFLELQSAFDYAYDNAGSTVKLLDNVSTGVAVLVGDMSGTPFDDMVDITLDLNGKTWEYTGTQYGLRGAFVEITLKSSVEGGTLNASKAEDAICVIYGTLVIESGTYTGGYDAIYNMYGSVVVEGGVIKAEFVAIYNEGTTTINGGILEATDVEDGETVYNQDQLVITGGTFKNASTIDNDITENATVTIAGGTYPNGLGVTGGNTLADVLMSNASLYDSQDAKITLTEDQTSVQGAVYVEATKLASVTTKDGKVKEFVILQSAFDYACDNEGATIKLLADITTDSYVMGGNMYSYTDISMYTLDLNGKTWKYTGAQRALMLVSSDVTIISSVEGGKIDAGSSVAVYNMYGMVTVESGTFVSEMVAIYNGGELIVNGGTITGSDAIYNNEDSAYINGGTITGTNSAIYNKGNATVVGGTLSYTDAEGEAVIINYGNIAVEGGKLDGAVTVANHQESEEDAAPTVSIAGGEYPNGFAIDSENAITVMTVKDALAEGCSFVDANGNTVTLADDQTSITGVVSVVPAKNVSVTTKDGVVTYYTYLSGALAEAAKNPGSTVTLLADITATMSVTAIGGEFTLDLNGKKYILVGVEQYQAIKFNNADVTIKSSVEGGIIDTSTSNMAAAVYNYGGTLTIESGVYVGNYAAIGNYGTLVIKDGTFKGIGYAVYNIETATIDGGTFEYTDEEGAIFENAGKLVINGGTFKGEKTITYSFSSVTGPMIGEAVIAGGYFADGIKIDSYDDTEEETLLANVIAEGYGFYDAQGTLIQLEKDQRAINEAVTVKLNGDADGDGKVNVQDAITMKKYLAGISGTGIETGQSDVNADGEVTVMDAVILMKYLAGDNTVVLGKAE